MKMFRDLVRNIGVRRAGAVIEFHFDAGIDFRDQIIEGCLTAVDQTLSLAKIYSRSPALPLRFQRAQLICWVAIEKPVDTGSPRSTDPVGREHCVTSVANFTGRTEAFRRNFYIAALRLDEISR